MKKLIVITGASSGIGAATARKFSAEGHPLLLIARRLDRMQALNLPDCQLAQADVTDQAALLAAIQKAEAAYGPTDLLINNAGLMQLGQIDSQESAEWQNMLNINVMGVLNGMQAVLPGMKQRQTGTIINVSSVAGRKSFPNHAAYCGTKFAVSAITETVREEVAADNIRVISVCPGAVETELLGHTTSPEIIQGYQDWKEQMGQILSAEDIANAIFYAYQQPQSVCLREIVLTATKQQP